MFSKFATVYPSFVPRCTFNRSSVCQNSRQLEFVFSFFAVFESVQKDDEKWADISKPSGTIFLKFGSH